MYLYTGGCKNDFYVLLRQSSIYLMKRGLIQIKRLYFFIIHLFSFAKICVCLRFNKDLNSVELRVTLW